MADLHRCYGLRAQPMQGAAVISSGFGLNHKDLPEVGTQSVVSEILPGERLIGLRQATLARRFGAPMQAFALRLATILNAPTLLAARQAARRSSTHGRTALRTQQIS